MKKVKVTVTVNWRNISALVRKNNFRHKYQYQFIGMKFDTDRDNTAKFYESTQVNENSYTNYPGIKIWHNYYENWTKEEVLERITDDIIMHTEWYMEDHDEVEFRMVGF